MLIEDAEIREMVEKNLPKMLGDALVDKYDSPRKKAIGRLDSDDGSRSDGVDHDRPDLPRESRRSSHREESSRTG
jgi:hypothetical protein